MFNLNWLLPFYTPNSISYSNKDEVQYHLSVGRKNKIPYLLNSKSICDSEDNLRVSDEALREMITARINHVLDNRQIPARIIVNEYHEKKNGLDIRKCFQFAKEANPNVRLIFMDTDNHYKNGMWTSRFKEQLSKVYDLVDIVGVQSHVAQWDWQLPILPTSDDIAQTLRSYGKPIWVTEFDVDTDHRTRISPIKKYQITYTHMRGFLKSGVVEVINFWGVPEDNNDDASELIQRDDQPHLIYYAVEKAIVDHLLSLQSQ